MKDIILQGNCLESLKGLPDASVDCCITSPPYYGLRDYGTATWVGGDLSCDHVANPNATKSFGNAEFNKNRPSRAETKTAGYYRAVCPKCGAVRVDNQIGLEETPEEYIEKLVSVFREVKRILKPEGTLWVNIGDSYVAKPTSNYDGKGKSLNDISYGTGDTLLGYKQSSDKYKKLLSTYKNKDLIGIPWLLAFALRNDGWYLRQDIIWHKPNPMPESVKDRCTKSHEYIFLLSKRPKYYFDYKAIQEDAKTGETMRDKNGEGYQADYAKGDRFSEGVHVYGKDGKRNKRDVWSVTPAHYKEAHFATFPEELVKPMLLAGCPKDGIVLDPFMGSGTTGAVAILNGRHYIGCELNEKYIEMANKRISDALIIANQVTFNDLIDKQMTFDNLLKIGEQT